MTEQEFNNQYEKYLQYVNDMFEITKDFPDYESFIKINPGVDMSPDDFTRYKYKLTLSKNAYWNAIIDRQKIEKKMINKILRGINTLL